MPMNFYSKFHDGKYLCYEGLWLFHYRFLEKKNLREKMIFKIREVE